MNVTFYADDAGRYEAWFPPTGMEHFGGVGSAPTGPFLRLSYVGASPEGLARGVGILKGVLDGPGDGDAGRPG